MKYPVRRAIRAVLLLFGVSVLCFLFTEMAPGSFFDEMRLNPQISPETISTLRARYGLDRPLLERYGHWLASVVQGDLGFSIAYNAPVAPLLCSRARNTLLLAATAMLLARPNELPLALPTAVARSYAPLDRRLAEPGTRGSERGGGREEDNAGEDGAHCQWCRSSGGHYCRLVQSNVPPLTGTPFGFSQT